MDQPLVQPVMDADLLEQVEIGLLLEGVKRVYGIDFSQYAQASLRRRLRLWLANSPYRSFSEAQGAVLRERACLASLVQGITVNVTEMFRDPRFFLALREQVIPYLKTYPFVKIWHAGCATGEEAYSMAILLHEAGMQGRYRLYATDINEQVLARAREGIYPLKAMQGFTRNYQASGGSASFGDYYTAHYERALLHDQLRENLVFAQHDLMSDTDFGDMHLVLCRNVMIYFRTELKERCLALFDGCLHAGGFLCLGVKESLTGRSQAEAYERFGGVSGIYRKRYG